ncbi:MULTISPECIES: hypothetical protein [Acinetobacter]|uniref:hypothetical protein n=1 Tax=Acinetobacter TaxID=469 RepID=UPI0005C758A9
MPSQNMPHDSEIATYTNPLYLGIKVVQRIYLEAANFSQVKWDIVPVFIWPVVILSLAAWLF